MLQTEKLDDAIPYWVSQSPKVKIWVMAFPMMYFLKTMID